MASEQDHYALIRALVEPDHRDAYVNDATFHAQIHLLADMLPAWVDGMAAQGQERRAEMHREMTAMMNTPGRIYRVAHPEPGRP